MWKNLTVVFESGLTGVTFITHSMFAFTFIDAIESDSSYID